MKTPVGTAAAGMPQVLVHMDEVRAKAVSLAEPLVPFVCTEGRLKSDFDILLRSLQRELICSETCRGAFLVALKNKGMAITAADEVEFQAKIDSMTSHAAGGIVAFAAMRDVFLPGIYSCYTDSLN
jgi:hypothetical protein